MKPDQLKQWRQRLSLGEVGMAAYLGVPRQTYIKWENGQRNPDSSTRRLFEVLQMIEELRDSTCAQVHEGMLRSARGAQSVADAPKRKGRPPKAPVTPPAPVEQSDIPSWLMNSNSHP